MFLAIFLLAATLFVSSIITPPLFVALTSLFDQFPWPYSRVFNRIAMLVAFILILLMRKRFDISLVREALKQKPVAGMILRGVLITLISSFILFPILVGMDALIWDLKDTSYYVTRIPKVVAGAALIALIEECFFRGLLQQQLLKNTRPILAIISVSLFYAAIHFIAPVKSWELHDYNFFIGFEYLAVLIFQMLDPQLLGPFIGLFLVGMALGFAMYRVGNIYLCIGLHAGWIGVAKSVFYLTAVNPDHAATLSGLAKRYYLVSHPVAWLSILLVMLIITRYRPTSRKID